MKNDNMVILVIRHGNTKLNKKKIFRGHTNIPLDNTGLDQAEKTGEFLKNIQIDQIYSSPLERAMQTAEKISSFQKRSIGIEKEKGFLDLSFGQWEGKSFDQVQKEYPEIYNTWLHQPYKAKIPGGEMLSEAKERAWKALNRLIDQHKGIEGKQIVAIVSHRVINKLLIDSVLGLDESNFWQIKQDPCCVNVFEYKNANYFVSKINHNLHLYSFKESIEIISN